MDQKLHHRVLNVEQILLHAQVIAILTTATFMMPALEKMVRYRFMYKNIFDKYDQLVC